MAVQYVYQGNVVPNIQQTILFSAIISVFFTFILVAIFILMRYNRYLKPTILLAISVYFLTLVLTYAPYVTFNAKYNATTNTTTLYLSNTGTNYGTILLISAIALLILSFLYYFYVVITSFRGGGGDIDIV